MVNLKQILKKNFDTLTVTFSQCKKHLIEEEKFDQSCTITGGTYYERNECVKHLETLLESIAVKKIENSPSFDEELIRQFGEYFDVKVEKVKKKL